MVKRCKVLLSALLCLALLPQISNAATSGSKVQKNQDEIRKAEQSSKTGKHIGTEKYAGVIKDKTKKHKSGSPASVKTGKKAVKSASNVKDLPED